MEIPEMQVKVRIETDVGMMAKAFADMDSWDQAGFLANVFGEMGEYTRTESDGSQFYLDSDGREMQMRRIKKHFVTLPDAREFIRTLYKMTMVEEDEEATPGDAEKAKVILGGAGHFNWDNPPGDIMEDVRKAKEQIAANTGLKPSYIMPTATRDEIQRPLTVISESVSWPGQGELGSPTYKTPRITCHCLNPIGMWYKVDDRVHVDTHTPEPRRGIVTKVHADGNVDVLLDAALPPAISPKEAQARVAIPSGVPETHAARIICDPNDLHIIGSLAHATRGGAYIGRVVEYKDDGTVVIEVAPGVPPAVFDKDGKKIDATLLDMVIQNMDRITDKVPPPSVDTCDECKGTGTWTNPANNQASPCSKGCTS